MARSSEAKRFMIGHFAALLGHCASLLPFIAENEDNHERYHVWDACATSFTSDFPALYYFMFRSDRRDANREDFVNRWQPSETIATERLNTLVTFIDKHRAHLSWDRYEEERTGLSNWVPPAYLDGNRLKATGYAHILNDYLDILDEFIKHLPSESVEKQLFFSAAFSARHKVNKFMGRPPPIPPDPQLT